MILTEGTVVPYLLQRQLINTADIVADHVLVKTSSRRNRNYQVVANAGPSYFVKQALAADAVVTLANEAAAYAFFHSGRAEAALRRFIPQVHTYDSAEHILVLECFPAAHNLREYHRRLGRFPLTSAAQLGEALAGLHALKTDKAGPLLDARDEQPEEEAAPRVPWILYFHRPHAGMFSDISAANLRMIGLVQRFQRFGELLDALREEWRDTALIHFDLKWDNVLMTPSTGATTALKVIDWELCVRGDPCWDIGSVFTDYLNTWLFSIPITGHQPPDRFPQLAAIPLNRLNPAIASFWTSYVSSAGLDDATRDEWVLRSTRYAAARLLQSVFEQMQDQSELTGTVAISLQLAMNMLERPREAGAHLLGLRAQ